MRCVPQSMKLDVDTERQALQASRDGLDSMFIDTAKKLDEEKKLKKVYVSQILFV